MIDIYYIYSRAVFKIRHPYKEVLNTVMKVHAVLAINSGMSEFKKAGFALFLLGFASFSLIYCVQPLLPEFTSSFHIAPSASALALSMTTGFLAFSIMGLLTEIFSWRISMAVLGLICLFCALGFIKLLPDSRNFTQRKAMSLSFHLNAWLGHLKNIQLVRIYSIGFLMASVFVTLFNYVTFRFSLAPYHLSQTQISLIFLSYSFGIVSSSIAGNLADRVGRKPILYFGFILMLVGVCFTLSKSLFYIVLGIAIVTTGFFISHSIASSNVGELARENKGHAASLYLLFYYLGSSIVGSMSGLIWQKQGWNGIVILDVCLILLALAIIAFTQRARVLD